MKLPAQADLQRWSEEVARDPASLAFLPLARAYRRQGLRAAARDLCLRGLEHYPTHAEAHSLLALLYLEDGDRLKAADEWSMVLRMDPNHFEALRGIGFCYLEQDQLSRARQALERAALLRPADAAVQEALKVLGTRQELHSGMAQTNAAPDDVMSMDATASSAPAAPDAAESFDAAAEPWMDTPSDRVATPSSNGAAASDAAAPTSHTTSTPAAPRGPALDSPLAQQILGQAQATQPASAPAAETAQTAHAAPAHAAPQSAQAASSAAAAPSAIPSDPSMLFASMTSGPLLGILLLDAQGLVLAGAINEGPAGTAEALGATLGPTINEAGRTVSLLALGAWRGMLLEAGRAVLHVSPVSSDAVVLLAAKRNAPTGWVLRVAAQAAELAGRYLKEYA